MTASPAGPTLAQVGPVHVAASRSASPKSRRPTRATPLRARAETSIAVTTQLCRHPASGAVAVDSPAGSGRSRTVVVAVAPPAPT
ncbi:MAG: hypothetical protein R2731_06975 [Nocardioides sp.]